MDAARALMHEWTDSEALRFHMEAVASCMGVYARALEPAEESRWVVAGLLHDFDYEKHPSAEEHPFVGVTHLESLGVDEEIRRAILGHAEYSGVARESTMAKALFACDELAGFIVACAKVRPNGIEDLGAKSVKKKLKTAGFAAAVSRDDIARGVEEFGPVAGVDQDGHITRCIEAIRGDRKST
ncbi:MAG: HD domain-containing protein, partial [Phycisphaerales bacterium]|nr:HD domain-containing protein [Phycisphaerales bacterium]